MGAEFSQEDRAYCPGGAALTEILQSRVSTLRHFYNTMIMHHFSKDTHVDKATLAYLLPYKTSTNSQLCAIFDVDENNSVNWKRIIGGLLLCVEGSLTEKIHLLFIVNKLSRTSVSQLALRQVLTDILQATDRIFLLLGRCHNDSSVYQGNVFVNIGSIVSEIICGLYAREKQAVTMHDFQSWAEENSKLIDSVFNCQEQRRNAELEHNGYKPSMLSPTSRPSFYSWKQLSDWPDSSVPCFRSKHASCLYDGHVYLYGGRDTTMGMKDFWSYNIGADTWEQIKPIGIKPTILESHTIVPYKGNLYMFGGEYGYGSEDETPLWVYNVDSKSWRKFSVDSEIQMPVGRRGHTAVIYHNAMHIYGGYMDLRGSTSEMWCYDFDSESFHLVYCSILTEGGAGPRHYHSAIVHGNGMWVFGGTTDLQSKNDLWRWSFSLRKWTKIKKIGPPEMCGHSAVKVMDAMLIFGGETNGSQSDQLWRFHFASESWQKIDTSGIPMIPRSFHSAVLVTPFNITSDIPSTERSHSVPHLKDNSDTVKTPRPYSSPPGVSPHRQGPPFKNRISPIPSPNKPTKTFSSRMDENKPNTDSRNTSLATTKDRFPGSTSSEMGESKPLLLVREASSTDSITCVQYENPGYQKSNESLSHCDFNYSEGSLHNDLCESLVNGVNIAKHGDVEHFSEQFEESHRVSNNEYRSGNVRTSQMKTNHDMFVVTTSQTRENECADDLVQVLKLNSEDLNGSLNGTKMTPRKMKASASMGSLHQLNCGSQDNRVLPGLVKSESLCSVFPNETLQRLTLIDNIEHGVGDISSGNSGNDLYVEDIEDLEDEFCQGRTESHALTSNGLGNLFGVRQDTKRPGSGSNKQTISVRESVDSGYMSNTNDAWSSNNYALHYNTDNSSPSSRMPNSNSSNALVDLITSSMEGSHSRYASTYRLGEEHVSSTCALATTDKPDGAPERPRIHGRSNTAPQSLAVTTTNRPRRKPQISLPEGTVCMLVLGGKETQQKQLGLSPLPVWKCDILQGLATPKQVQRLMLESATFYGS